MSSAFCQLCGRKITGRSKVFRHKKWPPELSLRVCLDCDLQKPHCRICGLPMAISSGRIFAGSASALAIHPDRSGVCTTCRASPGSELVPLCLACGGPIGDLSIVRKNSSTYYEFDGVGPYCETCYRERPPCDLCGAPLTDEHWLLSDGRILCALCHSTAIYAPVEASALYDEMKAIIAGRMGLALNIPTGLALVDRNQLSQILYVGSRQAEPRPVGSPSNESPYAGSPHTGSPSLASKEKAPEMDSDPQPDEFRNILGVYARQGMRRGIYVQSGLPRMLFLQVAAHEFAHAWQGENCPVLKDLLVHEGFAEWVAYQVIGFYGYTKGQERMRGRNDIYGRGLKWALEIAASQGAPGVVEACRRSA